MINHEYKFIFLHIPKCAGMSVGIELSKACNMNPNDYKGTQIHQCLFDYNKYKDYFVFTFVRNPYDRAHSVFKYQYFLKDYSFENSLAIMDELFGNYFERGKGEFIHLTSQVDFLKGKYSDGIDKFPSIDFIGRFENLQEDFDYVCDKIGIPKVEMVHANKSDGVPYKEAYNENSKAFVYDKFKCDFEEFNYEA